jgi:hypothetical protein
MFLRSLPLFFFPPFLTFSIALQKVDSLADFVPITESDFETFATLLADKAAPYKVSAALDFVCFCR